ncbi:hypothetical protein DL768_001567 [Monosporascus sp. mg162]|nr:hypothetical protein DL768_001567 [Monosporascus sp. mg162]
MADVYTPPPDYSYLLVTPFYMPTNSGSVWAIAFSGNSGTLVTAAISVVLTVIFMLLWNFICFIALLFPGRDTPPRYTRRRYVALVTLWNSNDAWFAFRELAHYAYHYFGESWRDCVYGFTFAIIAFVVFGGSLALGVVGPSVVQIGNVAPVRPSSVFYPATARPDDYVGLLRVFGLRAPGVLRALGSVEAARVTMRSRVDFDEDTNFGTWNGTEPIHRLTYSYSVTGVELGLQHGSDLALTVEGSCTTEYGWISDAENGDMDIYQLWGLPDPNQTFPVPIDPYNIQHAPKASFLLHPDADNQYMRDGNSSFAVVVWSARRASISEGSDPWYATEPRTSVVPAPYGADFWMRRGRPALSCWQQDKWSYGTQTVNSIFDLKNIPGIKIARVLLEVLEAALAAPVLTRLGNASGDSALRSRTTSPNGVINAAASSMHDDIERLLVASFVATRNVFVDATMFETASTRDNLLRAPNGEPADGAGEFVVASPNIQTFSMVGIIVLVVVLVALLLIESIITLVISLHQLPTTENVQPIINKDTNESANNGTNQSANNGTNQSANNGTNQSANNGTNQCTNETTKEPESDRLIRFKALSAPQLFRRIYEPKEGKPDDYWSCQSKFPSKNDGTDFELAKCQGNPDGLIWCKGHINSGHVRDRVPPRPSPPDKAEGSVSSTR